MSKPKWTEEDIAALKELWASGSSAGLISKELGDRFSRNAVIGVVARLRKKGEIAVRPQDHPFGPGPKHLYPSERKKADMTRSHAPNRTLQNQYIVPGPIDPPEVLVPTEALERKHCRFPYGNPSESDFGFCGRQKLETSPYCAGHDATCYQKKALAHL